VYSPKLLWGLFAKCVGSTTLNQRPTTLSGWVVNPLYWWFRALAIFCG
jgi:hypothetical protein